MGPLGFPPALFWLVLALTVGGLSKVTSEFLPETVKLCNAHHSHLF